MLRDIHKKELSETDICDLFITPAILKADWEPGRQIRREVTLTPGPVIVRGNLCSRNKKKKKFADYVLYQEPGIPVAVVEAKDNHHSVGHGMQQALGYAEILEYFRSAIQIGMTATPKETKYVSISSYFGEPVYTYSLKQGIADGFLAPYKVVRIDIDKDLYGWTPPPGMTDDLGQEIEGRTYNRKDMDRILVLNQRTRLVAARVMKLLNATDPFEKTIIFCEDIDHAERMRTAIVNAAGRLALDNPRYVMRITGDSAEGTQTAKAIMVSRSCGN